MILEINQELSFLYRWFSSGRPMFKTSDRKMGGVLPQNSREVIVAVFEEMFELKHGDDFNFYFEKFYLLPGDTQTKSSFDFQMRVIENKNNPFPPHLSDGGHPETVRCQENFSKKLEETIKHMFDNDFSISIHGWKLGSIFIEGAVASLRGEISANQQHCILAAMKNVAIDFFSCEHALLLGDKPIICIQFSGTAKATVLSNIQKNENELKKLILQRLKAEADEGWCFLVFCCGKHKFLKER